MCFLATAADRGQPQCYLSLGNVLVNPTSACC